MTTLRGGSGSGESCDAAMDQSAHKAGGFARGAAMNSPGLHAADHNVRLAAVRAVADESIPPEELLERLGESLADPHGAVRECAALILGESCAEDPALLSSLTGLVEPAEGDDRFRIRQRLGALHALGRAGLVGAIPGPALAAPRAACLRALGDESADVRYQAIAALRRLGLEEGHEKGLRAVLADADPEVAALAAELLADLADEGALEPMYHLMGRARGRARVQVIVALGHLMARVQCTDDARRDEVVTHLSKVARRIPEGMGAIQALGLLGSPGAHAALVRLARGWFVHRLLRVAAASALAELGDAEGWQQLRGWMHSRHEDARGYAMALCGPVAEPADVAVLIEALKDPADYHSDSAAAALVHHMATPKVMDALVRAAADTRQGVRLEVARALAQAPAESDALRALQQDDDPDVREAAGRAPSRETP